MDTENFGEEAKTVQTISVPITDTQVSEALRQQACLLLTNKYDTDAINKVVRAEIQELIDKEISKEIRKSIRSMVAEFASPDGYIESEDEETIKRISIKDEFAKTLNNDNKYKVATNRDGIISIQRDSYGESYIKVLFHYYLKKITENYVDGWVKEKSDIIKNNIQVVVTNNIKKELFGSKLPDTKLQAIATEEETKI